MTVATTQERQRTVARWVAEQFGKGQQAFLDWLATYTVDEASGILPAETTRGFPAPEREPDGLFYDPGDDENPYLAERQLEVWWSAAAVGSTGGELLAIRQLADPVMACDHFAWFRIPFGAAARAMGKAEIDRQVAAIQGYRTLLDGVSREDLLAMCQARPRLAGRGYNKMTSLSQLLGALVEDFTQELQAEETQGEGGAA